jgi:hypothetical protein
MSESKWFWDYLARTLHRWYVALIGVAFGIFGFVKDGLGWDIPMPSWFWWAAAFTALFVSQSWVYRDLYCQYEAVLSPEADCNRFRFGPAPGAKSIH